MKRWCLLQAACARSLVHELQDGEHVDTANNRIRIIHTATGNVVKDLGESSTDERTETKSAVESEPDRKLAAPNAPPPALTDVGWAENSVWRNGGTSPIVYFSTTWVVPPEPTSSDGQTIYLFNDLQPDSNAHIVQPVLQWGPSPKGGGTYWSITNWYADGVTSAATAKSPVKVNVGDVL